MVWMALIESSSRAEIENHLSAQFHISLERAKLDVGKLFTKLEEAGLIDFLELGFNNQGGTQDCPTEACTSAPRSRDMLPKP